MRSISSRINIIKVVVVFGVLLLINIATSFTTLKVDITDDKRFSLTQPTRNLINHIPEIVTAKILLTGEIPAQLKRLQINTTQLLNEFRSVNKDIKLVFEDPNDGTSEEIKKQREVYLKDRISPVEFIVQDGKQSKRVSIFPYVIFYFRDRYLPVNLLEQQIAGVPNDVIINNAIALLEYKLANAIKKLTLENKPSIFFTTGHGELASYQTKSLEYELKDFYTIGRIDLNTQYQINPEISVLIVAKPTLPFSSKDLYKIDQYVMGGGKVIWMLDAIRADQDSLAGGQEYLSLPYETPVDDLLFRYGVRIQKNVILDARNAKILLFSGNPGEGGQSQTFPFYYYPVIFGNSYHPLVKNIGPVLLQFPSTIDTLKTKTRIDKTVLLTSSEYSRIQLSPVRLSLDIVSVNIPQEQFSHPFQPVAVLLEGIFPSMFENRVKPQMESGLQDLGIPFKKESVPTKMIVVSDGDLIRNRFQRNGNPYPVGYHPDENYKFSGNEDFIKNALDYLLDQEGLMEARAKEIKIKLLDKEKVREEKNKWQFINVVIPILCLLIFGGIFSYVRKKKYTKTITA